MVSIWNKQITLSSMDADGIALLCIMLGLVAMFGAVANRDLAPAIFMGACILSAFGLWIMPNAVYVRGRRVR